MSNDADEWPRLRRRQGHARGANARSSVVLTSSMGVKRATSLYMVSRQVRKKHTANLCFLVSNVWKFILAFTIYMYVVYYTENIAEERGDGGENIELTVGNDAGEWPRLRRRRGRVAEAEAPARARVSA